MLSNINQQTDLVADTNFAHLRGTPNRIEFVRIVSVIKELKKKEYFNTITDKERVFYTHIKNNLKQLVTVPIVSDNTKTFSELYRNTQNFLTTMYELVFNYNYFAPDVGVVTKGRLTLNHPTNLYSELFLLKDEHISIQTDKKETYILYNNGLKHFLFGEDKGCTCALFNYYTGLELTNKAVNTHNENLKKGHESRRKRLDCHNERKLNP
jgi:hypothetical protein